MAKRQAKQEDFDDVLAPLDEASAPVPVPAPPSEAAPARPPVEEDDHWPPRLVALLKSLDERIARLEGKGQEQAPAPVPVEQAEAKPGLPRWRVSCACPTPLKHPVMELSAADQHQAKMAYCAANGISNSVHPWRIERLPDPDAGGG